MIRIPLLLALVFLTLTASTQPPDSTPREPGASSNPLNTPLDRRVDSLVRAFLPKNKVVGLCVAVRQGGQIRVYGYGETAQGSGKIPDGNTVFEIGSISKTFTASLLADAVGRGEVRLDDPVSRYLPDSLPPLEFNGVPITLKTLSNHTSGLPRLPGNIFTFRGASMTDPYAKYGPNELFQFLKTVKLTRPPGEKYDYSNLAAGLLGTVLERVAKKSYEILLAERIARPLGLKSTILTLTEATRQAMATGHDERGKPVGNWDFGALAGAGAVRSTALDLLTYLNAEIQRGASPLGKAMSLTQESTFDQAGRVVGLGWHQVKGEGWFWHNGKTGGFSSFAGFQREKDLAVVVLANTQADTDALSIELTRVLAH